MAWFQLTKHAFSAKLALSRFLLLACNSSTGRLLSSSPEMHYDFSMCDSLYISDFSKSTGED